MNQWLSFTELESLARLFGSFGVDHLCDSILKNGIIENAKKWLSMSQKLKANKAGESSASNASAEVADNLLIFQDILNVCIRFDGLDQSFKIVYYLSVVTKIYYEVEKMENVLTTFI